jgi:hypothetical protein
VATVVVGAGAGASVATAVVGTAAGASVATVVVAVGTVVITPVGGKVANTQAVVLPDYKKMNFK